MSYSTWTSPATRALIDWDEIFTDQVLFSAIRDRRLHDAATINLKGESYRLQ